MVLFETTLYLLFRSQLEVSRAEVNLYKHNLNKRDTEHKLVLREGDELLRIADETNQELLKYIDFVTFILRDRLQILLQVKYLTPIPPKIIREPLDF